MKVDEKKIKYKFDRKLSITDNIQIDTMHIYL